MTTAKPWLALARLPPTARPQHDHQRPRATIQAAGVQSFGSPQAHALRWPLNRAEALAWLDHFITTTLPHFGAYEDAMSTKSARLFHSLLSFALNTKMLRPHRGGATRPGCLQPQAPRPCLRWRLHPPDPAGANMCAASTEPTCPATTSATPWATLRRCPIGSGRARPACAACRHAVGQSLEHAYAHHIQRALGHRQLCAAGGFDPAAVHCWYKLRVSTSTPLNGWNCPTPWA